MDYNNAFNALTLGITTQLQGRSASWVPIIFIYLILNAVVYLSGFNTRKFDTRGGSITLPFTCDHQSRNKAQ
jgi:hypothetical protein